MKKLFFLFAFAGALGASAADTDSFIYWMVPEGASGAGFDGKPFTGDYYVRISAIQSAGAWTEGGEYLTIRSSSADNGFTDLGAGGVKITMGADNVPYLASIAGYAGEGWTYFVELWNDTGTGGGQVVAHSEGLPYAQASIVALSGMNAPGAQAWAPMTFVPAPEPNSAMLLLIGCAALALRRRKQIAA